MTTLNNKERLTWDEIVEKYPDKWVALENCERTGAVVYSGIPIKICKESDMYSAELDLIANHINAFWIRTTELEGANVICRL